MKISRLVCLLTILAFLFFPHTNISAQSNQPNYPVYIVQPGDTINVIAIKFNVSAQEIIDANGITDPNLLSVNTRLIIPGIKGVTGVLSTKSVAIGETLDEIARVYQLPKEVLLRLNQITSPSQFFIGSNVILVEGEDNLFFKSSLSSGESFLEMATKENVPFWDTILENSVDSPWQILPQETMVLPKETNEAQVNDIEFVGLPLTQGNSSVLNVRSKLNSTQASIGKIHLNFFENGFFNSSIFGIHAMLPPGLYPFHAEYINQSGKQIVIDQLILIQQGFYPQDPPLHVDPETLDDSLTKSEEELIFSKTAPFTNEKYWSGLFRPPVDEPICIKSWFGNRRSYNDQPYNRFHAGVDFGVCANLNIYSPADGKVVFTGFLVSRGNATIIDHGLGVYSIMCHQSEIQAEEGQFVKAGDLIGQIGTTGRSTGPHLHWELIVNGVQVDALPWLDKSFP